MCWHLRQQEDGAKQGQFEARFISLKKMSVRVVLVDFTSRDDCLMNFLKEKFSKQQMGRVKWMNNRLKEHKHFIPIEFSKDAEFLLDCIRKHPKAASRSSISPELLHNRQFLFEMTRILKGELHMMPASWNSDRELVIEACKNNPLVVKNLSKKIRRDKPFMLEVV